MEKDAYSGILTQVRKFATRWRLLLLCEGLIYTAVFASASLIFCFLSDNLFHFSPLLRGGILLLVLFGLVVVVGTKVIRKVLMRVSAERAALYIESRLGRFDNKLINALQLGKDRAFESDEIIKVVVSEAAGDLRRRHLNKSLDLRRTRKFISVLGATFLVLVVYWLCFGKYFENAFARFANLAEGPLPITRINLSVAPGDVMLFVGDDLNVSARTTEGPLPEAAFVVHSARGKKSTAKMEFDGESFLYSFRNLQHGLRYRVAAGDFKSKWYRVGVGEPLRIERIEMTLSFPEYLRIPAVVELDAAESEVRVLEGTKAELRILANRRVKDGQLLIDGSAKPLALVSPTGLTGELLITDDVTYRIRMEDARSGSTKESLARKFLCFKDLSPGCEILQPKSDYWGTGEENLAVIAKATDDVALSSVKIVMELEQVGGSQPPLIVREWSYNQGLNQSVDSLKRMAIETTELKISDYLRAGQSGFLYAVAADMKGNTFPSSRIPVSVMSPGERSELERAEKESVFQRIREILNAQLHARSLVNESQEPSDARFPSARAEQVEIHGRTLSLLDRLSQATQLDYGVIKTVLLAISMNEMVDVVKQMNGVSPETFSKDKPGILSLQDEIVWSLQRLLGEFAEEESLPEKEPPPAAEKPLDELLSKLRELNTILKNFVEEQRKVITSSLELQQKKPEDYTKEDEELKRKLQTVEDQWAKFLEEKSSELDKIPKQDFSKPTLLKELRQIYEEIEVAADELSKPGVRIPVTEEQIGLELAEKLQHNLESWLPDESDKIRWELEEPSSPPEVPMAELPEELEDIVGELIREEEELDPEMEDMSSSWMDSIDAGAGWDTMDGPISNMSAKGKTGNTLPNSSEISGRSAEGRTGKSNGEFVSDTAIGKGGRRTPTRVMNDPYENATVDDQMSQPTGGATGGGKRSGAGGEGLRGHVPPDLQTRLAELRGKQADLITRGERTLHVFDKLNLSAQKLEETIEKMRQLDENMRRFKYTDLVAAHEEILEGLKSAQKIISHEWEIRRESSARFPNKVRKILSDTLNTEFPRDYEALLREYYKAISE